MVKIVLFETTKNTPSAVLDAKLGQSLMKAAVAANIEGVAADCGGTLTCATCHVMVREPWFSQLPAMTDDEDGMLDFAACTRQPNSRLSCQIHVTEAMQGMEVDLPASQY
ncbi:MAG: 2Fe-2S iron-sulfur cluster binding domain-containing protein [Burkholderiales bacterium]|jgi:2Fe-2S ferredoxin|nr:2Fe-2S iron-sulfur cluster binding domain-containing protein [Burkholderiales bacterium]